MRYTAFNWVEQQTPVGPSRMNPLEQAVQDATQHQTFGLYANLPTADSTHEGWLYFALDHGVCYQCAAVPGSAPTTYAWVPLSPRTDVAQDIMPPGVIGKNDLAPSTFPGQVQVGAGTIWALNAQGLLQRGVLAALQVVPVIAGEANPRIDSIMALLGSERDGSINSVSVYIVKGTATAGATLDNRTGAPSGAALVPGTFAGTSGAGRGTPILIADLLMNGGVGSNAYVLRDRRVHAGGIFVHKFDGTNRTSNAAPAIVANDPIGMRIEVGVNQLVRIGFAFAGWAADANSNARAMLMRDGADLSQSFNADVTPWFSQGGWNDIMLGSAYTASNPGMYGTMTHPEPMVSGINTGWSTGVVMIPDFGAGSGSHIYNIAVGGTGTGGTITNRHLIAEVVNLPVATDANGAA